MVVVVSVRSELRQERLAFDGYSCRWPALLHEGPLQMAHLVQSSQGGPDKLSNVVSLCELHHGVLDNHATVHGRRTAVLQLLSAFLGLTDAS